jgi:hypothetical protein
MNWSRYIFIAIFTLIGVSSASADNTGFGEGALTDTPDAICKLTENGRTFCSGTIVKSEAFRKAKLVTAGHCFDDVKNDEFTVIRAMCGCTRGSCLETFILNSIKYSSKLSDARFYDTDHAIATLDHKPRHITPIELSTADTFADLVQGALLPDVACVTGGFGMNESFNTTTIPHVFETTRNIGLSKYQRKKNLPFLIHSHLNIAAEDLHGMLLDEESDPKLNELKSVNQVGYLKYKLVQLGYLKNVTMNGDSGSGLLCKFTNGSYKLIGTLSGSSFHRNTTDESDFYILQTHFSPVQPKWL